MDEKQFYEHLNRLVAHLDEHNLEVDYFLLDKGALHVIEVLVANRWEVRVSPMAPPGTLECVPRPKPEKQPLSLLTGLPVEDLVGGGE